MSERYWCRLGELLEETRNLANSKLQPCPSEQPAAEKGLIALIAFKFQGQNPDFVDSVVRENASDVEWTSECMSKKAGAFSDYGIDVPNLADNVRGLLETKLPTALRIRVFESDIALLSVPLAERILKVRASLKQLRSRIDVCFRILCAIEKMGKKVSDIRLEKMKLQFEKLEQNARKAQEKAKEKAKAAELKAAHAEKVKEEREKKRQEKELLRSAKQSSEEKKRRSLEARANFMRRFVSKRVTPQNPGSRPVNRVILLDSPEKGKVPAVDSSVELVETTFQLDQFKDRSVMPVSYWLRTLIGFDNSSKELGFLESTSPEVNMLTVQEHLAYCSRRRKIAEKKIILVLKTYRSQRTLNRDDKTPRFSATRSELRGRGRPGPLKYLKFDENNRPAFFGTNSTRSTAVSGRRPFGKDDKLDYEVDSDDEWEEGESLADVEEEKERATEDAELRMLYGSDDDSDDDDFLDDAEADDMGDGDDDDDDGDEVLVAETGDDVEMANTDEVKEAVIDVDAISAGKKRPVSETNPASTDAKKKRRRKSRPLNQARIEIIGIEYGDNGSSSLLNRYPITRHANSMNFKLFDPRDELGELKSVPSQTLTKTPAGPKAKNVLDAEGIIHLAMLVHGTPTSRDKTARAFLNWRRDRKEVVPTLAEVSRVISGIAVREKREKDTKANWYLKDAKMEAQVIEKNKTDLSLRNKILQLKHTARTMIIAQPSHPMLPVASPTPIAQLATAPTASNSSTTMPASVSNS